MRINRYIARSGVTSRRKAEDLIKNGQVTINDVPVTNLATEIAEKDKVKVDGKIVSPGIYSYLALNKPEGYAVTKSDPYAMHTVFELLPDDNSLFAVGRLDRDTTGLLIVTNDGDFGQNLIHPSKKIEKEYQIRTQRPVNRDQIEELLKGVELDDGPAKTKSARVLSERELALVIEEGRKRIVRRMIDAVGNKVVGLKRTRIGEIKLDVEPGRWRELTNEEIEDYV